MLVFPAFRARFFPLSVVPPERLFNTIDRCSLNQPAIFDRDPANLGVAMVSDIMTEFVNLTDKFAHERVTYRFRTFRFFKKHGAHHNLFTSHNTLHAVENLQSLFVERDLSHVAVVLGTAHLDDLHCTNH